MPGTATHDSRQDISTGVLGFQRAHIRTSIVAQFRGRLCASWSAKAGHLCVSISIRIMLPPHRVADFGSRGILSCVLDNHYVGVKFPISPMIACSADRLRKASNRPRQFPSQASPTSLCRGGECGAVPIGHSNVDINDHFQVISQGRIWALRCVCPVTPGPLGKPIMRRNETGSILKSKALHR